MRIITCSNGYSCHISHEKLENQAVLKIDFNIKGYESLIPGRGCVSMLFPQEVLPSIKDKLYINKQQLYNIVEILDTFIDADDVESLNTYNMSQGFSIIQINDIFNNKIYIRKSSAIDKKSNYWKLWFGTTINIDNVGIRLEENESINVHDKLLMTVDQVFKLRMAMLHEIMPTLSRHDIADFVDKNTKTANNMIMDMWGDLHENVQKTIFMYACGKGNLPLVKCIYKHPENKFMNSIFCSLEEFGLQMSLDPESKKILKFFKIMMKEQDMELSQTMQRWVRENKLGRKIRLKN